MIIESIKKQIEKSGLSRYQIWKDTGVDQATLSRLMQGKTITVETADILLEYFGLKIELKKKKHKSPSLTEHEKCHVKTWSTYAQNPYFWHIKAEAFIKAAKAFRESAWPENEQYNGERVVSGFLYGYTYMLLTGLAVEVLLKGILIGKNPNLANKQKLSGTILKHNLVDLYGQTGFRTSRRKDNLLEGLTNCVECFGRYPVTKNNNDMKKMAKTNFMPSYFERIDSLLSFLEKEIQPLIEQKENELSEQWEQDHSKGKNV